MTDVDRALALLVHAHAPAATSAGSAIDDPSLRLRDGLGFDLIALAEQSEVSRSWLPPEACKARPRLPRFDTASARML